MKLTNCRGGCGQAFQGLAGDHDVELCNSCAIKVGRKAAQRLTECGPPVGFPERFKHCEEWLRPAYDNAVQFLNETGGIDPSPICEKVETIREE